MASAHDVAAFILAEIDEPISTMKLQKLLYYAQAWSVAWDRTPLFDEPIERWDRGPVVREVWSRHRLQRKASWHDGEKERLSVSQKEVVREVVRFYNVWSGDELSALSHTEPPWRDASPNAVISLDALRDYFGSFPVPAHELPPALARGINLMLNLAPEELEAVVGEPEPAEQTIEELVAWLEASDPISGSSDSFTR